MNFRGKIESCPRFNDSKAYCCGRHHIEHVIERRSADTKVLSVWEKDPDGELREKYIETVPSFEVSDLYKV